MESKRIVENLAREFMLTAKASITTIFVVVLLFNFVKAYEQSHPLSQIHPIDVNLNMYGFNVTNASYVGIGTAVPEYPLDVYGSGRFTGNLYVGGTIYGNLNGEITAGGNLNMMGYDIYNATNLNTTNLFASNAVYQNGNQVIDTIAANSPIIVSGSGNSRTIGMQTSGVTSGTYGSASKVPQITVDQYGRITSASNVNIAIDASQITSGILPLSRGGTGADLSSASDLPIKKSGSSFVASAINLGTSDVTGTLPISHGGTGATSASSARSNLGASGIGTCPNGYVVQNLTTGAPECVEVDTSNTNELQNIWYTISVPSGSNPVPDSTSDTLTLSTQSGSGLTITGDSSTDTVTFGVDFNTIQKRVSGSCDDGYGIRIISSDGTVTCQRFVKQAGDTMGGNLGFTITRSGTSGVVQASKGILWSGLSDSHNIFVEEYSGTGENTRLVIESSDNGDNDYTVFRNNQYNVGEKDVFEIHRNYIVSNATLQPKLSNTYDLGTSSLRWKNGYFAGDLYVSGTIHGNIEGDISSTGNLNMNGHDIYNANNVNATRFFQNGKQVIDTINAGGGISVSRSGSSATINHADTSSQGPVDNSGLSFIQDVSLDEYGHVTGLGTNTIVAGNGLTSSGTTLNVGAGTGIVVGADTVSVDNSVVPFKSNNEHISGSWIFDNDLTVMHNLRVAGNLTYVNSQTLNVNGSVIPPLDNWFDLGNSTNRWRNVYGVNGYFTNIQASNINGGSAINGEGSANYVAKWSDSDTLTTSTIYDNGNVGIGTTNPQYTLDVNGNIGGNGYLYLTKNGTQIQFGSKSGLGYAKFYTTSDSDRIFITAENTPNVAQFASYGLWLPRDVSTGLYVSGGIQVDYAQKGYDLKFDGTNDHSIYQGSHEAIRFLGDSSDVYLPGNVGVGTTNPEAKLEIDSSSLPMLYVRQTASSGADASIKIRGSRNGCTSCDVAYIDLSDWDSDENSGTDFTMARISAGMNDVSGQTGYLRFYTNSGGSLTEKMRITKNGNVGIGTTSPSAKLDVSGTFKASSNGNNFEVDPEGNVKVGI